MTLKKCPICSSRVMNGVCSECGYSIPDETEISSVYNYDPDDDNFSGEKSDSRTEEKYSMPEVSASGRAPVAYAEKKDNYEIPDVRVNTYNQPVKPKINVQPKPQNNGQAVNPYANFSPVENQKKNPAGNKPVFSFGGGSSSGLNINWLHIILYGVLVWNVPFLGIFLLLKHVIDYLKTRDKGQLVTIAALGAIMFLNFIVNFVFGIALFAIDS